MDQIIKYNVAKNNILNKVRILAIETNDPDLVQIYITLSKKISVLKPPPS
tara:strand:+ start:471 stop:620 length:150 start_codon:yes stop_codon:yes gene_type:complete